MYDKLFVILDDEEMKNVQIREKIKILQQYVKPSMLGIDKIHLNMKTLSKAINGWVNRNPKTESNQKPKTEVRGSEQCLQNYTV